jgi:uncharacterized protein DUF6262
MTPTTPSHLAHAAARRASDAEARARRALAELDRADEQITFAAVARRAHVSRQFLYNHHALRGEIAERRTSPAPSPSASPERASENSLRTRLRAALEDNQRLRTELTRLRTELAIAHGRNRELRLEHPTRPT